ncbi:O-antigen ligase family protein [Agromyces salentinus]|uniref:O-antigen ligase-related domain-containing protein n=1 Tax=Agromyces salentinus TaxID=269421 RepID=A0ABP4Z1M2_9MICO|nr:O-antigen ligase family protein [Agromyces salentinus]
MPAPVRSPFSRRQAAFFSVWLLLVVSVVSWRPGVLFTGGVDPVVIAKAAVGLTAVIGAVIVTRTVRRHGRVGARSLVLLLIVVAVSSVGAIAAGDATSSLVLSARIVLVTATVVVLVASGPPMLALTTLLGALGAVALVAAVTGIPELLSEGRLGGGIPDMQPNEVAGLAAPAAVALVVDLGRRGLRVGNTVLFAVFAGILFATGSRTTLVVVGIAVVLALVIAWPIPRSTTAGILVLVPIAYVLLTFTDVVEQFAVRGQSAAELASLSSRTIAWTAVLEVPFETWAKWIGVGLAVKTVTVNQRWWDSQVLDSSWVSVLAQAGVIGMALVGLWVVATTLDSLRSDRMLRSLTLPLLVLIVGRSILENGLIESSAIFALFLTISLVLEPGSEYPRPPRETAYGLLREPEPWRAGDGRPRP